MPAQEKIQAQPAVNCCVMAMRIEKISAITFRVVDMGRSVRFYRDVLGMELLYGGEGAGFSSLRAKDVPSALNLELGHAITGC